MTHDMHFKAVILIVAFTFGCALATSSSSSLLRKTRSIGAAKTRRFSYGSRSSHRQSRQSEPTVCETCHMNLYNTPFYCPIQPDLPQCIFPICPKICEDSGGDPRINLKGIPPPPPKRPPFPPPVNMPKIPNNLLDEFTPSPRSPPLNIASIGRSIDETIAIDDSKPEKFSKYNPDTCEFQTPTLRRIRPGSKYIEYRPTNISYQISDILNIAIKFGLVPAEFRHPMEWYSVEKSSIMESVSTYKMTMEQPRRFYVVGLSDDTGLEREEDGEDQALPGKFLYKSDGANPSFAVFDPRIYGRKDERCGVLSHVLGSDKRQYLTTRFWNCHKYMGDKKRVAHGLLMFPPDSLCYQRSEEGKKTKKTKN